LRDGVQVRQEAILARLRVQYGRAVRALETAARVGFVWRFQRRLRYLSAVSARDYGLIETFKTDMANMQEAERQREAARVECWRTNAPPRSISMRSRRSRKRRNCIWRNSLRKESFERALQELERLGCAHRQFVAELSNAVGGSGRPPSGSLPKGVKGVAVAGRGQRPDLLRPAKASDLQHLRPTEGIEIRTLEGSAIHAVMAGTVVYADWLKGYGLVIILDHANGFFSLYAHARKSSRRSGRSSHPGRRSVRRVAHGHDG
jgi:murein DD-endopeptidase MepM/ murein hydrolase activator NlpD